MSFTFYSCIMVHTDCTVVHPWSYIPVNHLYPCLTFVLYRFTELLPETAGSSPVAQAWNLAIFGNNHFFAFFNSSWCTDEILPGWELASGLAFSESKMAAKDGNRIMRIDISS